MQVPSRTYKEEKRISCDIMSPHTNSIKQCKINDVESSHFHTAYFTCTAHLLSVTLKSNRHYSKFKGDLEKNHFFMQEERLFQTVHYQPFLETYSRPNFNRRLRRFIIEGFIYYQPKTDLFIKKFTFTYIKSNCIFCITRRQHNPVLLRLPSTSRKKLSCL